MQDHAGSPTCPLEQPSGVVLISVWSNCTLGIGFDAEQTRRPGCAGSYSSCQSSVFRRVLLGVFQWSHAQNATTRPRFERERLFCRPLWAPLAHSCDQSWKGQIALRFTSAHLRPDPLGIKGGTDRRKGSMAFRQAERKTVRQSDCSPFSDNAQSLPATHPNTALRYCTCHIRSPGGMSCMYLVLCHTLPHPRKSPTGHPHTLTHRRWLLTHTHTSSPFPQPSRQQHNGPGREGVGRHPTTLPPARRAPCPRILSPF